MVLMTIKALSEKLHVKTATLYIWTSQKKIPYIKIGGGVRFEEGAIDEWLKKHAIQEFER